MSSKSKDELAQAPADGGARDDGPSLEGHVYDGIQELDNPTPSWWTWIFVGTIVFSALYFFVVHTTGGKLSPVASYRKAVTEADERAMAAGELKQDAETLLRLAADESMRAKGRAIFTAQCSQCHGTDGSGMTGPNLTDDHYIHVKKVEDLAKVINDGANNGAMPPLGKTLLRKNDVTLVAAYVASLRGKNLRGPRAAEGEAIPAWSAN